MRNRTLTALLVAELVSTSGSAMTFLALPWFVLVTTGSASRMSVVLAAEILPMALFGIPSGSVVARYGSRRTMLFSDLFRAPLIALIPALHWAGRLDFPALVGIVFVFGVFTAPYLTSQRTIIPELFADDETAVAKASGLLGGAGQLPLVIGPALAGVLISWFGTPPLLLVDAGTFLFAFVTVLVLVRAGRPVAQDDESKGVLAGVRYLARDKLLGPMTLTFIVLDGAGNALTVAVPLLAFSRYHRDPHIAGWIFAAFGIGAVIGSVLVVKALDRVKPLTLASAAMALVTLPLWVIAFDVPWLVVCGAVAITGVLVPFVNAPLMGIISTRPPLSLRQKVMTAVMTASGVGAPLGRLVVGPVYGWDGNTGVWLVLAGAMTLGAILFIGSALRPSARGAADVVPVAPIS
jgi:predicted MFS family arabinose efflux permease